jgi:hypothetical protein
MGRFAAMRRCRSWRSSCDTLGEQFHADRTPLRSRGGRWAAVDCSAVPPVMALVRR